MSLSSYQTNRSIPLASVLAGAVVRGPVVEIDDRIAAARERWVTPVLVAPYALGNSGLAIRVGATLTGDFVVDSYQPRTELGRQLLALRRAYVEAGGQLLESAALDIEIRLRKGGVTDA